MNIVRSALPSAVVALCVSLALTACSSDDPDPTTTTTVTVTSSAPSTPPATTAQPTQTEVTSTASTRCTTDDLTGELIEVEPGAGQRYAQLLLTNASDESCTIFGYGGAQLVAPDGSDLPTNLVRDASVAAGTLTLEPGQSAQSQLHWSIVAGAGDEQGDRCQPDPDTLAVIPPDETTALEVPWTLGPVCEQGRIDQQPYISAN